MLQTLERNTTTFDARMLTPAHREALLELCGPAGLPDLPAADLLPALQGGQVLGDYGGSPQLQAAAALVPLYADEPLPAVLRAAGFGADGQGAVLTPPVLREQYPPLRHFLRMALRWATERYASYHIWAVLPLDTGDLPGCEDLCAQYLSAGMTLRAVRPLGEQPLLIFSARGIAHWQDPYRRLHLDDPALPRLLERGYAAADFGWGPGGMELLLRAAQ